MKIFKLRSYQEYCEHLPKIKTLLEEQNSFLEKFIPIDRREFKVPGYSYTSSKVVDFVVDYKHSGADGPVIWRESVQCPFSYFNNRMRATFHLHDLFMDPYPDTNIYLTEQVTPIYDFFKKSIRMLQVVNIWVCLVS